MSSVATVARRIAQTAVTTTGEVVGDDELEAARAALAALTPHDEDDSVALAEASETLLSAQNRRP